MDNTSTFLRYDAPPVIAHLATLGWNPKADSPLFTASLRYNYHVRNDKYPSMYLRGVMSRRNSYLPLPDRARFVIACEHPDARGSDAIPSHTIDVGLKNWEVKCTRAVSSIAMSLYALANKHMERDQKNAAVKRNRGESLARLLAPHDIAEADFLKVFDCQYDWATGDIVTMSIRYTFNMLNNTGLPDSLLTTYKAVQQMQAVQKDTAEIPF